jgi:hypothetical protein
MLKNEGDVGIAYTISDSQRGVPDPVYLNDGISSIRAHSSAIAREAHEKHPTIDLRWRRRLRSLTTSEHEFSVGILGETPNGTIVELERSHIAGRIGRDMAGIQVKADKITENAYRVWIACASRAISLVNMVCRNQEGTLTAIQHKGRTAIDQPGLLIAD